MSHIITRNTKRIGRIIVTFDKLVLPFINSSTGEVYFMTYFRSAPMFHHSVWSVITAHNLTPAKRDVTIVVSDQRSRFTAPSIDDYNTPGTVVKHRRPK